MKRLFAFIFAFLMIFTASTAVFATEDELAEGEEVVDEFEFSITLSQDDFNYGEALELDVSLTLDNVPEEAGGISVINFAINYDTFCVTPSVEGAEDENGLNCDFSALVSGLPEDWECFGMIDTENGIFDIAVWDDMSGNVLEEGAKIDFTVPFTVNGDTEADLIAFAYADMYFYGGDITKGYGPYGFGTEHKRALQPTEKAELPEDAIPLDIAGYKHAANNVIYYSDGGITVGNYISSYMEITNGQDDMNYFAIAIVSARTNEIVYVDFQLGRPASDKSGVIIPAGHYIIGVNGNKQEDYEAFTSVAEVGKFVTLFNVNVEPTGKTEVGTELISAGFIVCSSKPEPYPGGIVVYDEENDIVYVYESNITNGEFEDMFKNDITVFDKDGAELAPDGLISTGMVIGDTTRIVVLGDVNGDGEVNQYDYILVKRHYLGTFTLEGDYLRAACINDGESVQIYDYIFVKRAYFGTFKLSNLLFGE